MDADRFDALARSLDLLAPRRAALGALGGGLAVLLGRVGIEDAEAKKKKNKKRKKKCKGKKKKCGKKCIPKANCCKDSNCGPDQTCVSGACTCPTGFIPCGAECIEEFLCCTDADCGGDILSCEGGFCTCPDPSEIPCTASSCCDPEASEVCAFSDGEAACQGGGCPETDFCNDTTHFQCGIDCFCVTSVDDSQFCTTGFFDDCSECIADADCEEILGEPGICITGGGICEDFCPGASQFCITLECVSEAPSRTRGRNGRSLANELKSAR